MIHVSKAIKYCQLTSPTPALKIGLDPRTLQQACVCVRACFNVCLCMYFIVLAPANLLTPDGEQWVSRLYFLLDLILIDRYTTLPHSSQGKKRLNKTAPTNRHLPPALS